MTPELFALSRQLVERRAFLWELKMRGRWPHGQALLIVEYNPDRPPAYGYVPDLSARPTVALLAVQAMNEGVSFGRWGKQWRASLPDESSIIADTLGEAAARALLAIKGVE